jgi:predicted RND superfamily exporter protein
LILQIIVLLLFFRSVSATIMSLLVVVIGVIWSFGTMHLFHYQITALSSLIGPLIIVIGIPNCIYFLNKYHASWQKLDGGQIVDDGSQHSIDSSSLSIDNRRLSTIQEALCQMVSKMGIVTLFCNIAAAIGFAVFAFTSSALLKEFGVVAGINIMALFLISLVFIPAVLSFLPQPKPRHVKYLDNPFLEKTLLKIEHWVLNKKTLVYTITGLVIIVSVIGMFRLKAVGFMLDDLPKQDKIYTDLKWFEHNFGGVMPLEIVVDTKKKNGLTKNLQTIQKMDELSTYIDAQPECARPLSLVEGLKFVKQAYYSDDSLSYAVPTEFDMAFLATYLKSKPNAGNNSGENTFSKLLKSYMDSTRQKARITVNMADIGTQKLPIFIDSLRKKTSTIFDSSYNIQFTGGTITYLEGSKFIINGLRDSIVWAFLLIAVCMLYLFKSVRILICSLIPNLIPLICTAGLMGWAGVPLKPSTVLVFSVALGIAIDVTIRFLINFKQELPLKGGDVLATSISTIKHTGISIIYTSLVLVAGFIIFCFSSFGGTVALGWLTSFTLLIATLTNLILLPVLLLAMMKKKK